MSLTHLHGWEQLERVVIRAPGDREVEVWVLDQRHLSCIQHGRSNSGTFSPLMLVQHRCFCLSLALMPAATQCIISSYHKHDINRETSCSHVRFYLDSGCFADRQFACCDEERQKMGPAQGVVIESSTIQHCTPEWLQ